MDGLFGEISAAAQAMGLDGSQMGQKAAATGFNPYATDQPEGKRSEAYSDAELMQLYQKIQSGQMGPEMAQMFQKMQADAADGKGADGKPLVDPEGGTTIQP